MLMQTTNQGETMNTDKLTSDLKVIAHDAEDLIKATAGEVSEKAKEARSRLMVALESAKESCGRLQDKAVASAKATDQVIRAHPYESIGVAFGVGLLIGVLLGRRGD
jgi:ElaB/YqjD/DUF883 family membrane-anchored ribosome-binding protein